MIDELSGRFLNSTHYEVERQLHGEWLACTVEGDCRRRWGYELKVLEDGRLILYWMDAINPLEQDLDGGKWGEWTVSAYEISAREARNWIENLPYWAPRRIC